MSPTIGGVKSMHDALGGQGGDPFTIGGERCFDRPAAFFGEDGLPDEAGCFAEVVNLDTRSETAEGEGEQGTVRAEGNRPHFEADLEAALRCV